MREVTEISSEHNKKDKLKICLDGDIAFEVDYTVAAKFGLKVGKTLSDEEISAIKNEESEAAAFDRGLKYAVKKVVSEKQMRDYLARNGFSKGAIESAISKLKSYDYVSDTKFAKAYVATYSGERGSERIARELKNAGVDAEIIDDALSDTQDGKSCNVCLEKYLRTHKNIDRRKIINYLLYRGFDWDTVNEAINRRGL